MSMQANSARQIDPILNFDPWYLRPAPEVKDIKHTDYYIKHNEKKKGQRKVYQKVTYDEFERKHIEILKADMQAQNIEVPQDWKESDYLKMCYCGRFDAKKDLKAARDHIEWRNNSAVHSLDRASTSLLENGMIYLLGRDNDMRPIIYLDCSKINLKKDGEETILKALCTFLDMIKKYMFVDYNIENWIMVIDTCGLGLTSLPINGLKLIISSMSINYCATMEKMYILNPSFMLNTSWNIIKSFIDPESVEKIQFLKPKEYKEMQKKIPLRFLQKKYSGEHPDIKQFWPPLNVFYKEEENKPLKKISSLKNGNDSPRVLNSQNSMATSPEGRGLLRKSITSPKEDQSEKLDGQRNQLQKELSSQRKNNQAFIMNKNDGIKPQIIITAVPDDKIDQRYALAGFDEDLEKELWEKIKSQKSSKALLDSTMTTAKDEANAENKSNLNQQEFQRTSVGGANNNNNNNNNYNTMTNQNNISTLDHSEAITQNVRQVKHMQFSTSVPELADSSLVSNNNIHENQVKISQVDETQVLEGLDSLQNTNKPGITFEGEDQQYNSRCCNSCAIF